MIRGRLRRGAALPPALAALALFAGCGSNGEFASKIGGEGTATESTAAAPAPEAGPNAGPTTPGAAARFVNLRADDFPYLPESEAGGSSSDGKSQREFEECVGDFQPAGELASAESPSFGGDLGGEYLEFSSSTGVFHTAADVGREARLFGGHRLYACFQRLLQPALEREETGEVELLSVKTHRLRFPEAGIPTAFAYRIVARVAASPESRQLTAYVPGETPDGRPVLAFYLDLLFFVEGRIGVTLTAIGGPQPVPGSLERNLLRVLRERAGEAGRSLSEDAHGG